LSDTREQDIIPIPSISSVAFVFNLSNLSDFKVRFGFGMVSMFCSRSFLTPVTHQSVSFIIFDRPSTRTLEPFHYWTYP
jgi:hypothetical protein